MWASSSLRALWLFTTAFVVLSVASHSAALAHRVGVAGGPEAALSKGYADDAWGYGGNWFPLGELVNPSTPQPQRRGRLAPLLRATSLAYTATYGGYYRPADENATVEGFRRSAYVANPPSSCGMRAVVFVEELVTAASRPPRVLVAFRGTDLSGSMPSSLCDACANEIIFNNVSSPSGFRRAECRALRWADVDYVSQAGAFVESVRRAHPLSSLRFVGHSLGSALATAASLRLALCGSHAPAGGASAQRRSDEDTIFINGGVVGVGSPGAIYPLLRRVGGGGDAAAVLSPSSFSPNAIVLLNNYYDPIYATTYERNGLYGHSCDLWRPRRGEEALLASRRGGGGRGGVRSGHEDVDARPADGPSQACVECRANSTATIDNSPQCATCAEEVHMLRTYLQLLLSEAAPAPDCSRGAATALPEPFPTCGPTHGPCVLTGTCG